MLNTGIDIRNVGDELNDIGDILVGEFLLPKVTDGLSYLNRFDNKKDACVTYNYIEEWKITIAIGEVNCN